MRFFLIVLSYILMPVMLIAFLWRGIKTRGYWQRIPERVGFYSLMTCINRFGFMQYPLVKFKLLYHW